MIQHIAIVNPNKEKITIPLGIPTENGFAIKSIEGLGPVEASVHLTDFAVGDGGVFNSTRVGEREITLTLVAFESPGRSIEQIRMDTYRYFPVKKPVIFEIKTDTRHAAIVGYVSQNTPEIFSERQTYEIKITCPDPYFYSIGQNGSTAVDFANLVGGFEFAFSNEHLANKLLQFGEIRIQKEYELYYPGDVETGVKAKILFGQAALDPRLVDVTHNTQIKIDHKFSNILGGTTIQPNDEIHIDTRRGHKSAYLHRAGKEYSIISNLGIDSGWLTLIPGTNAIGFDARSGSEGMSVTIEYNTLFGGV